MTTSHLGTFKLDDCYEFFCDAISGDAFFPARISFILKYKAIIPNISIEKSESMPQLSILEKMQIAFITTIPVSEIKINIISIAKNYAPTTDENSLKEWIDTKCGAKPVTKQKNKIGF